MIILFGLIRLVKKFREQIWLVKKNWRTDPACSKKLETIFVILFCWTKKVFFVQLISISCAKDTTMPPPYINDELIIFLVEKLLCTPGVP